jgi:hypothetical protein
MIGGWTTDKALASKTIGKAKFGHSSVFANALDLARDFFSKTPLENKAPGSHYRRYRHSNGEGAKLQAIQRLTATDISVHVLSYARMEVTDIGPRTKAVTNSAPPQAMPPEVVAGLPNGARDVAQAPKAKSINLDRKQLRSLRGRKTDLERSERQLDALATIQMERR